jgi:hypothetical protein
MQFIRGTGSVRDGEEFVVIAYPRRVVLRAVSYKNSNISLPIVAEFPCGKAKQKMLCALVSACHAAHR